MSLFLQENSTLEKVCLIKKLINIYLEGKLTSYEIHYILDVLILSEIQKDKTFDNEIKIKLKDFANMVLSNYTGDLDESNLQGDLLFGENKLKIHLIEFGNSL